VLAWIFLKERLNRNQWIGIAAALIAIVLMTI
jgi:EamA domain-containing membrane protein RarD